METFIDCGCFNEITSTQHANQMWVYDSNWQHDVLAIKGRIEKRFISIAKIPMHS